jgi:hypothetical protein
VTRTNLSEIAPDLWIAEQPLRYLGVEAGRRMTVIRLADGLLIHSPASLGTELRTALDRLGELRFVIPASEPHGHLYMEQYRTPTRRSSCSLPPASIASARTCKAHPS